MKRLHLALVLVCALLPLGMRGPLPTATLPPVSSGPPPALEPMERVLRDLSARHTGLSQRDLEAVAATVVAEAERYDMDVDMVLAVIHVESGGYNFAVSPVGARGLMQLMPATGEELAREAGIPWSGPDTLFDPVTNVQLGVAYLDHLSERYGSWSIALAAYNWGPGRIDRRLRRGAALPSMYVERVMKRYEARPVRGGARS